MGSAEEEYKVEAPAAAADAAVADAAAAAN
jgi:hypothetical protein